MKGVLFYLNAILISSRKKEKVGNLRNMKNYLSLFKNCFFLKLKCFTNLVVFKKNFFRLNVSFNANKNLALFNSYH